MPGFPGSGLAPCVLAVLLPPTPLPAEWKGGLAAAAEGIACWLSLRGFFAFVSEVSASGGREGGSRAGDVREVGRGTAGGFIGVFLSLSWVLAVRATGRTRPLDWTLSQELELLVLRF